MQRSFLVWIVALLALAASCSKPLAPTTVVPDGASVARAVSGGGDSREFVVRLRFTGPVVTLDRENRPRLERNADFYIYSTADVGARLDTVPAYSTLRQVQWKPARTGRDRSPVTLEDAAILGEAQGIAGAATDGAPPSFTPGLHEMQLQAPPRAGGRVVTVRFYVGFAPIAWWAGPDPARWPASSDGDGRAVDVTDWTHFTTVPAWPADGRGYFGPDSFRFVPSRRRPVGGDLTRATDFEIAGRRAFYEIYGNRIYARAEGDTVHANAWVVLCNGGFDKDSPYAPRVDASDPALPPDSPEILSPTRCCCRRGSSVRRSDSAARSSPSARMAPLFALR